MGLGPISPEGAGNIGSNPIRPISSGYPNWFKEAGSNSADSGLKITGSNPVPLTEGG